MNTAATFNEFVRLAEQDSKFFAAMLQAMKSLKGSLWTWWLRWVLLVFLAPFLWLIAQLVPILFKQHLQIVFPILPYLKERESLILLKDVFLLYHEVLKGYRELAIVGRKRFDFLIEDLDEQIDSIEFVLENQPFLENALSHLPR